MKNNDIEAIYPLSPMQQGMLFHSLYTPESGEYLEQLAARLTGEMDIPAFKRAWQAVVDRHAILRTAFAWRRVEQNLQVVQRSLVVPFATIDLAGMDPAQQAERIAAYRQADRQKGFDLSKAPLLRLALFSLGVQADGQTAFELIWTHHHILLDGWSLPLLIREVMMLYEGFRAGRPLTLPPARPFRDYINWLQKQDQNQAEPFWRAYLKGFRAPTPLGVDHPGQPAAAAAVEIERAVDPTVLTGVQRLARANGLTPSVVVQAAWAILLSRYSRENDVVFGTTFSGRSAPVAGIDEMIGLLINTLPVRAQIDPHRPLLPWLRELQINQAALTQHEACPLVQIQGWSEVPQSLPLFESLFIFENYPVGFQFNRAASLQLQSLHGSERTNFPLVLIAAARERLVLKLSFDPARVDEAAAERALGHLETLLQAMTERPEAPIGALQLVTAAERRQILVDWNQTDAPYPAESCAHQIFAQVAAQMPDQAALEFEDQSLTYQLLDSRANQLAGYLRARGAGAETIAGVLFDRSPEMIVAMLGILKAGGAFLPLDPAYPADRLQYMLQDSGAQFLLTDTRWWDAFPDLPLKPICLDTEWDQIAQSPAAAPENLAGPDSLAYVIYTSGSTGRPKGVQLIHRGLANLVTYMPKDYNIGPGKRVLQFASASFDASVAEIFSTLCTGATLVLVNKAVLTSQTDLLDFLRRRRISNATLPPSLLALLPSQDLPDLDTIITAGEACPVEVANRWVVGRRLVNGYGPTEATVSSTAFILTQPLAGLPRLPIGRPNPNTRAYVLDEQLNLVPIGAAGELYVGGVHLARGYLNRPELTAERFIPDPYNPGERLYKTGDLVRWLPSGDLDILGRIDLQVKLRGFRIELGEIESVLVQHPAVAQAVVTVHTGEAGQLLVAYLVARDPADPPTTAVLRAYLKDRLPEYMLPGLVMVLETLPLNPAGKVDRKALPAPDGAADAGADAYLPPRTHSEEILAGIWGQVLNLPRVSASTNFFDAGGHSLLVMRVVSRVREVFQVELPIKALFEAPTLTEFARVIDNRLSGNGHFNDQPIKPAPRTAEIPLSFSQQRLWFIDQLEPGGSAYNLPAAVRLTGPLDLEALQASLQTIVRRHEALRTRFNAVGGSPVQIIDPDQVIPLPLVDLAHLPAGQQTAEALRLAAEASARPFDLVAGPLLRAAVYRLAPDQHILVLTIHHIAADGWSLTVLIRELAALYAEADHSGSSLPALPVQYPDFACWQRDQLKGETLEQHLSYWQQQLADLPPLLDLPTDHHRPAVQSYRGGMHTFSMSAQTTARLRDLCARENITPYMALLAVYQTLLYRYTAQTDIPVGTAVANRNRAELEGLIGFFVNNLVLRGDLSDRAPAEPLTFRELLKRTRKVCLGAYSHQDLPFEMLVDALQPQRDLSRSPLFQAAFDLQAAPADVLEMPGLQVKPIPFDNGSIAYDLLLSFTDLGQNLTGALEYARDLFEPETAQRMMDHFVILLEAALADPDQPISRLPLLSPAERRQLLVDWNASRQTFRGDLCAHQWFEYWVNCQPDAPALIFEGQTLTYAQLNQRANALAHRLRAQGIGPDTLVAVECRRGFDLVTAELGILKAGGAFLPLDPTYPADRLAFMLADSQAPVLVTHPPLMDQLPDHTAAVVCLPADADEADATRSLDGPAPLAGPNNLAYVIYTSGSTGKPKGALLRHGGLVNLIEWQRETFDIRPGTRVLQFASASFDASVWDTFMALGSGGTLVLPTQETVSSGPDLIQLMRDQAVNVATIMPSVLAVLPPVDLPALRVLVAAGEACPAELVHRWAPGRRFFNAYGPTETTVCACAGLCDPASDQPPTIGRPVANTRLYVLDAHRQPVPDGVPGELYVGGPGVARGYLNRPELTAERFVPDPFSGEAGSQLYRTGDRVRWVKGEIAFLGRLDNQVKIRGFRIELGEIETVLLEHPAVHQAVVMAREDHPGSPRLAAYVVPEPETGLPDWAALRDFIKTRLPDYMVPTAWMALESLPLNPNGKVDRKKLPVPDQAAPVTAYAAPRTATEKQLVDICADLLKLERVGINDSFFELGGHSLLAAQFIARVRDQFQVEVPLRTLFEQPTAAGLAAFIDQARPDGHALDAIADLLKLVDETSAEDLQALLESAQPGRPTQSETEISE